MRGVARQKHSVPAEMPGFAAMNAEHRRPPRIGEAQTARTELVDQRLALLESGLAFPVGGRVGDDQPPAICGQREKRQRAGTVQLDLRLVVVAIAFDFYISQHEMLGIGAA